MFCTDVDVNKPDEKSIMTYVAQFLEKYPDPDQDFPSKPGDTKVSYHGNQSVTSFFRAWKLLYTCSILFKRFFYVE